MTRTVQRSGVKEGPLSEFKDDLSHYLREAETQEIVITRQTPAHTPLRNLVELIESFWHEF